MKMSILRELAKKSEIGMSEAADVWEHRCEIAVRYAEPSRERRGKFIHARRRNPAAVFSVVGTVHGESWEFSVKTVPDDRTSHDKLMTAPAVIAAAAVRRQGAAEIGRGESGDGLFNAELDRRVIKSVHAATQFLKQTGLRGELVAVRVVSADRDEKDLALHTEIRARGDKLRDHGELFSEIGIGKLRVHGHAFERAAENFVLGDRAAHRVGVSLFEEVVVRKGEQILETLNANVVVRAAVAADAMQALRTVRRN